MDLMVKIYRATSDVKIMKHYVIGGPSMTDLSSPIGPYIYGSGIQD